MSRKRTPEGEVQAACLQYLKARGIFHWRQNNGGVRLPKGNGQAGFYRMCSIKGVSDILGVLGDGRMLAVEVKAPGQSPTPVQEAFLRAVGERGGVALCVDDVQQLADALDAEEAKP